MRTLPLTGILRDASLWQGLPAEIRDPLVTACEVWELKRREILYLENDASDALFLVVGGLVCCSRSDGAGPTLTVGFRSPGHLFGEECLAGQPRGEMAVAHRPSLVVRIPRTELERAMDSSPLVARRVAELVARRSQATTSRLALFACRASDQRLALALLELAHLHGHKVAGGLDLGRFTAAELASYVASTRETVALNLAKLRERGLLTNVGRSLVIADPQGLAAVAKGGAAW